MTYTSVTGAIAVGQWLEQVAPVAVVKYKW